MCYNKLMINLNKTLFWDVNFKDLDFEKHDKFIISRVLSYGDVDDFKKIKEKYGIKKIKRIAKEVNLNNKKSLNFWSLIFNLPLNKFKCSKKLLKKEPSAFWNR